MRLAAAGQAAIARSVGVDGVNLRRHAGTPAVRICEGAPVGRPLRRRRAGPTRLSKLSASGGRDTTLGSAVAVHDIDPVEPAPRDLRPVRGPLRLVVARAWIEVEQRGHVGACRSERERVRNCEEMVRAAVRDLIDAAPSAAVALTHRVEDERRAVTGNKRAVVIGYFIADHDDGSDNAIAPVVSCSSMDAQVELGVTGAAHHFPERAAPADRNRARERAAAAAAWRLAAGAAPSLLERDRPSRSQVENDDPATTRRTRANPCQPRSVLRKGGDGSRDDGNRGRLENGKRRGGSATRTAEHDHTSQAGCAAHEHGRNLLPVRRPAQAS